MSKFIHLHNHSSYSLLDGFIRIPDLLEKCKEYDMPAVAVTDHSSGAGLIDFYTQATKAGIKPILGAEFYMVDDASKKEKQTMNHITLLAKNNEGYRTITYLLSEAHFDGHYYKPRIDHTMLEANHEGIIILTGCNQGKINRLLRQGKLLEAKKELVFLQSLAPTYFEIQYHGLKDQQETLDALWEFLAFIGEDGHELQMVITNDCHYINKEDEKYHDALLAIQTKTHLYSPERFKFDSKELYFKNYEEIKKTFKSVWPFDFASFKKACNNTLEIAKMCEVNLGIGELRYPQHESKDPDQELYSRLFDNRTMTKKERERAEYEYDIIKQMGFSSYFLILHDFVEWCEENHILLGPGRGSVVGSLVAYLLGITDANPLDYGLLFERFLNPDRFSPPDIDIDVPQSKRGIVLKYFEEKYGKKNVAQILAFGTIGAKAAVKDAARITNAISFDEANKITKGMINNASLRANIAALDSLQQAKEQYPEVFDYALNLEGIERHNQIHASGIVIGNKPLTNYVPILLKDGKAVVEADMYAIEDMGLLKIDILGLRNLDIIQGCIDNILGERGIAIEYDEIPLDDPLAFSELNDGNTFGIFQLETDGITKTLLEVQPYSIEELAAVIALFRPGPKDMIPLYLEGKDYGFDLGDSKLNKILEETYGVAIYQEQLMEIAREIGGFTLQESDILRKAIGKKDMALMKQLEEQFFEGGYQNGYNEEFMSNLWILMEKAGNYAFNKSHALGYAILAMKEAWLKTHYGMEFYIGLLNYAKEDNLMDYVLEISKEGIEIRNVDINESLPYWSVDKYGLEGKGRIRIGFNALKYVGEKLAIDITYRQPYDSIMDFCVKVNPNLNALRSLIACGAFDTLHFATKREDLIELAPDILKEARASKKRKKSKVPKDIPIPTNGFDEQYDVTAELQYMKFSTALLNKAPKENLNAFKESKNKKGKGKGVITKINSFKTKKGEYMAWVTVIDKDGEHKLTVFPKQYQAMRKMLDKSLYSIVEFELSKNYNPTYGLSLIVNKLKKQEIKERAS